MSDWKPGDVAIVLCSDGNERTAIVAEVPSHGYDGANFIFPSGGRRYAAMSDARRLVVIDPDDREQVERLTHAIFILTTGDESFGGQINNVQAALRQFANPKPPKPEEPAGRYAVVLDDEDIEWIRSRDGDWCYTAPKTDMLHSQWVRRTWDQIGAVKVLSEGVTE